METYYTPEDLAKFEQMGKDAPELAQAVMAPAPPPGPHIAFLLYGLIGQT